VKLSYGGKAFDLINHCTKCPDLLPLAPVIGYILHYLVLSFSTKPFASGSQSVFL
jgi:hypothetical protein